MINSKNNYKLEILGYDNTLFYEYNFIGKNGADVNYAMEYIFDAMATAWNGYESILQRLNENECNIESKPPYFIIKIIDLTENEIYIQNVSI